MTMILINRLCIWSGGGDIFLHPPQVWGTQSHKLKSIFQLLHHRTSENIDCELVLMVPTQNQKKNQGGLKENLTLQAPRLAAGLTALPVGTDFSDLDSSGFSDLLMVFPAFF